MKLFLDMDGVFADFDRRVVELMHLRPSEMDDTQMWTFLSTVPHLYKSFDLMSGAPAMWAAFCWLDPTFLTGVPLPRGQMKTAGMDKRIWIATQFGDHVPVITCASRDKAKYCSPGDVLVDDRDQYAHKWIEAGGIFMHHTPENPFYSVRCVLQLFKTAQEAEQPIEGGFMISRKLKGE